MEMTSALGQSSVFFIRTGSLLPSVTAARPSEMMLRASASILVI